MRDEGGAVRLFRGELAFASRFARSELFCVGLLLVASRGTLGMSDEATKFMSTREDRGPLPSCRKASATFADDRDRILIFSGSPKRIDWELERPASLADDLWMYERNSERSGRWTCMYRVSSNPSSSFYPEVDDLPTFAEGVQLPRPRWKSGTATLRPTTTFRDEEDEEDSGAIMFLFGGDALDVRPERAYLDDLWFLKTSRQGQEAVWTSIHREHPWPSSRRGHAATSLSFNRSSNFYIQGGRMSNKQRSKHLDVWMFGPWPDLSGSRPAGSPSIAGASWILLFDGKDVSMEEQPCGRQGHSLVGAIVEGRPSLFLFFGRNDTSYFRDLWRFDLGSRRWTEIRPSDGQVWPEGRDHQASMVYARRNEIWIFGGRGGDTRYTHSHPMGDLWMYRIDTGRWKEMKPRGSTPSARYLAGHDDTGNGKMYIFGGEGKHKRNDLWVLDVAGDEPVWQELSKNDCPSFIL